VRADAVADVDAVLPEETIVLFDAKKTAQLYKVAPATAAQPREVPLNVREVGAARVVLEARVFAEPITGEIATMTTRPLPPTAVVPAPTPAT
jgi:hypothetical protein